MKPELQHTLIQHIHKHIDQYLTSWQGLYTQLYTLTKRKIQDVLVAQFTQHHMPVQLYYQQDILIHSRTPTKSPLTLLCYMPFGVPCKPDYLVPLLASLTAITAYQQTTHHPINMLWICLEQTEPAITLLDNLVAEQALPIQANGCLYYTDPDLAPAPFMLALGTKGLLRVRISTTTARTGIATHYGSIVPNAAWQLSWLLASLKDKREDILLDGFYDDLEPLDDEGIALLQTLPPPLEHLADNSGVQPLTGLQGLQQQYAYFLTPTCTITTFQSRGEPTSGINSLPTIPYIAVAELDFHLLPEQDPLALFVNLQTHIANEQFGDIQLQLLRASHPCYSPLSNPFMHQVHQAIQTTGPETSQIIPLLADVIIPKSLKQQQLPIAMLPQPQTQHMSTEQLRTAIAQEAQRIASLLARLEHNE